MDLAIITAKQVFELFILIFCGVFVGKIKMINEEEIEIMLEKMKEIIADQLSVDADSITETTSFKDDLGADSLDLFELVMALEDEYSVEIPSEDLQNLLTVGDVMNYLKGKGVEA